MIKIRKAEIGDTAQLETLFLTTRQQTFCADTNTFKREDYNQATNGEVVFVAEDPNGKILGFVSVWEQDKFIHHLFIAPEYQKMGVGTLLVKSLPSWLPLPYRLKCVAKNKGAIAFYQKTGWMEVGRGTGEDGEYLLMELPVQKSSSNITVSKSAYRLERYNTIPKEYEELLQHELSITAFQAKGLLPIRPFSVFIKNDQGDVLGGASGTIFYGSLYIDSLWVDKTLRHQGWGTKLVHEAENIGRKHGASFVTLNTMDWEALLFYQKLGYSIEFIREGYKKESKMFMLRKNLLTE